MTQVSWPLAEHEFTDQHWRDMFGDEAGIVGDIFGTAYGYTLSASSDAMSITASATRDSVSIVGGFGHKIVAGTTEDITVPAAVSAARTDLIVVRCDPATYTTAPGPNRIVRIAGTEGAGTPSFDATPPGVEDMPLYAVTRTPGQTLSQATVVDRRHWTGRVVYASTGSALGSTVPVGTIGYRDGVFYLRTLSAQGSPTWTTLTPEYVSNTSTLNTMGRLKLTAATSTSSNKANVYIDGSGNLQRSTYTEPSGFSRTTPLLLNGWRVPSLLGNEQVVVTKQDDWAEMGGVVYQSGAWNSHILTLTASYRPANTRRWPLSAHNVNNSVGPQGWVTLGTDGRLTVEVFTGGPTLSDTTWVSIPSYSYLTA